MRWPAEAYMATIPVRTVGYVAHSDLARPVLLLVALARQSAYSYLGYGSSYERVERVPLLRYEYLGSMHYILRRG